MAYGLKASSCDPLKLVCGQIQIFGLSLFLFTLGFFNFFLLV